jgi:ankyrin repeat protein
MMLIRDRLFAALATRLFQYADAATLCNTIMSQITRTDFRIASLALSAALMGAGLPAATASAGKKTTSPARPAAAAKVRPNHLMPELHFAVATRDAAGVRALLKQGADPNGRNFLDLSALTLAAGASSPEIAELLLSAGARLDDNSILASPVAMAAMNANEPVALLLLERGARPDGDPHSKIRRMDGITALMHASRSGLVTLVGMLLKRGEKIDAADNSGMTALMHAARTGQTGALRRLLSGGAAVNPADTRGFTALMHASQNGHGACVEALLAAGAKVDAREKQGRTALLLAATYGDHPAAVQSLLNADAERNARDRRGRTPLAVAQARGYEATANLLRQGSAPRTVSEVRENTPEKAIAASMPLIERSVKVFSERTGCTSCHHEGLARYTTGFAKQRGYVIDEALVRTGGDRVDGAFAALLEPLRRAAADPRQIANVPSVEAGEFTPMVTSMLFGRVGHNEPVTEATAAAALVLARLQTPMGDWRFGLYRVPIQSSYLTMTAMAVRVMQDHAPAEHADEIADRVARAKEFLLRAETPGMEDMAFRLLGLHWAGASAGERKQAIADILSAQRPDGGWSQQNKLKSDAYATGQALFALAEAGGVPVSDPAFRKGIAFLLRTQDDDGSWFVNKRAILGNNYFDTTFPHGQSQYISHIATCWATMALMLVAEPPAGNTTARGR